MDFKGDILNILFPKVLLGLLSNSDEPWDPELAKDLAKDKRFSTKNHLDKNVYHMYPE